MIISLFRSMLISTQLKHFARTFTSIYPNGFSPGYCSLEHCLYEIALTFSQPISYLTPFYSSFPCHSFFPSRSFSVNPSLHRLSFFFLLLLSILTPPKAYKYLQVYIQKEKMMYHPSRGGVLGFRDLRQLP